MDQVTYVLNGSIEVFRKLSEFGYNDFILAGGAPRDLLLNRRVSDLDFIVRKTLPSLEQKIINNWGGHKIKKPDFYGNWQSSTQSFDVIESIDGMLQFIMVECHPYEFVNNTFDIGLCQAVFTPQDNILVSDAFMADVIDKSMTVLSRDTLTVWQAGVSIQRHVPKLQKKYQWPTRVHVYEKEASVLNRNYPDHVLRKITPGEFELCRKAA